LSSIQRRFSSRRSARTSISFAASSTLYCPRTIRSATICISVTMRSHSGTLGSGVAWSSWVAKGATMGSFASPAFVHTDRRAGRSPVSRWNFSCAAGAINRDTRSHAASPCLPPANTTRLDPPGAADPMPSGPGFGAVAQLSSMSGARRLSRSPMVHGPERNRLK